MEIVPISFILLLSFSLSFLHSMFCIDYATRSFRKKRTSHWHFSFCSARVRSDSLPKTTNPERKRSEWMKRWMSLLMNEFTTALLFRVIARITMTMATTTTVVAFAVVFTIFSLNHRLSSDTLQTWWRKRSLSIKPRNFTIYLSSWSLIISYRLKNLLETNVYYKASAITRK